MLDKAEGNPPLVPGMSVVVDIDKRGTTATQTAAR